MKEILIITYGYNEDQSNNPNAICLYEIMEALTKENKVTIITTTTGKEILQKAGTQYDTIYVPISKKANGKLDFKTWVKEAINVINKKIEMSRISKLMTISFPFPIHKAGLWFKDKYPDIEWIVYELDPFAYNLVLRFPTLLFGYRFVQENRVLRKCDSILLTHELFELYSKKYYARYMSKSKDIGIPLMKVYNEHKTCTNEAEESCNITYIGSFYRKIREPYYMLEALLKSTANSNDQVHIYGVDSNDVLEQYRNRFDGRLFIHGRVAKSEVLVAIEEADVLVNIGNTINNQLPSKVLEYIGTGKPIINFYSIPDDTSNRYLKKYPNSLLIKQDDDSIEGNVLKIQEFIHTHKEIRVPAEDIKSIFKEDTLDAVGQKISNLL